MQKLLSILLIFINIVAFAHDGKVNTTERCFKAYDPQGNEITVFCVGQRIRFKDCTGKVDPDKEYYDFDDRDGIDFRNDTTKFKIFSHPGQYRVTQYANLEGINDTYSRVFEVKPSPDPNFTLKACNNNTVTVFISDTNYDYYSVEFGDEKEIDVAPGITEYQFISQGPYNIRVTGKGLPCNSNTITQTVNELPAYTPPKIISLKVDQQDETTGSISFLINNLKAGYTYSLLRKLESENDFSKIAILTPGQPNYTLANTNTTIKADYRIEASDACGTTLIASNEVSNIILDVSANNGQNSILWQNTGTFQQLQIYRDGVLLAKNPSNNLYTDTDVICGKEYCYEIVAIESDGQATSVSVKKCVTAVSNVKPKAPYLLSSFNKDNKVILSLVLPQGEQVKQVKFEKSTNSGAFTTLTTTQQVSITDAVKELSNFCYKASFTNLCNNTSESSNVSCPIILQAKKQADGAIKLSWSRYVGFQSDVKEYLVEQLDASGKVIYTEPVQGNTYTIQEPDNTLQFLRYRVKAASGVGNEVTYSNIKEVEQDVQLQVPSAFTPNNDGLNDTFKVKGKLFSDFSIKVYNNQGSVVYHSTDAEAGWDGTFKNDLMPAGVYAYEIIVKTSFGVKKRRTGTVTLLR